MTKSFNQKKDPTDKDISRIVKAKELSCTIIKYEDPKNKRRIDNCISQLEYMKEIKRISEI